jgi:hypothetical protein
MTDITISEVAIAHTIAEAFRANTAEEREELSLNGMYLVPWAAQEGYNQMLSVLLGAGFSANKGDAIFAAIKFGNLEGAEILRAAGAITTINDTHIIEVAIESTIEVVEFALDDLKRLRNDHLSYFRSTIERATAEAAVAGNTEIYRMLREVLPEKGELMVRDRVSLFRAIAGWENYGNADVLKAMIEEDPDGNIWGAFDRFSGLEQACENGSDEKVEILLFDKVITDRRFFNLDTFNKLKPGASDSIREILNDYESNVLSLA